MDKYPYADVDNFETTTVKDIADVEEAASKFGDPDAKGKGGKADAASLVDSFNAMAEGDADFDAKSFKSFVKEKGGKAVKEIADAIRKMPSEAGQSDLADDEIADMIENMFEEAGTRVPREAKKELDALRGGEKESDTKQAEKAAEESTKSAKKDADSNAGSKIANEFTNKVLSGVKPEQYAKMFAKNPAEIARALAEQINSSDKRTASDAKFAAAQLAVFMDPKIRESGIGKEISNHPELKEFVEEYDEARELTNGVYEDYKYRQAVMQQLNEFKRTRNGFVSKLLEIYGGKKDK